MVCMIITTITITSQNVQAATASGNDGADNLEACSFAGRVDNVFISKTTKNISPYAFSVVADGNTTYLKNVYGYETANFFVNELMTLVEETRDEIRCSGMIGIAHNEKNSNWDKNAKVSFISLSKNSVLSKAKATSSVSLNIGKSKTIKVTLPAGFTKVTKYTDCPADVKVTFQSSNPKVATVSSGGKVTGKKKGTAKITVNMQIKNGAKKTVTTTVKVSDSNNNTDELVISPNDNDNQEQKKEELVIIIEP